MSTNASASMSQCEAESSYYNQLDQEGKARYKQKLDLVEIKIRIFYVQGVGQLIEHYGLQWNFQIFVLI